MTVFNMALDLSREPHRRFNPLTGEWVLVSPQRTQRPWQGQLEPVAPAEVPAYDPACYMCPGNVRANGESNPRYKSAFVFDNDFPALLPETSDAVLDQDRRGLMLARGEPGICRVICYSPRHDLRLATLDSASVRNVVELWAEQYSELGAAPAINYVQIFENRGAMMGASNPHPHCQVWANSSMPDVPEKEQKLQQAYLHANHSCLLCDYLQLEDRQKARLVLDNKDVIALVPFWAVWPFETMVLPRRHLTGLDQLTAGERTALAQTLQQLTQAYDRLFNTPFPYSMGFHQRPTDGAPHEEWHLHAHFYPPLLRSAAVRKFLVGYELLATPQRDITPETAAAQLRQVAGK
ncbi:MAG TPA: UDP-glucose--hexose-1-phosphate uridylyltransferase [Terriglobales bacterium]|jgi:UDPglucose--hexose-1-phosphate uridylyltransferase